LFIISSNSIGLPQPPKKEPISQSEGELDQSLTAESSTPSFLKVILALIADCS